MEEKTKESVEKLRSLMEEMHSSDSTPDNVLILGKEIGFLAKFDSVMECATALLAAAENDKLFRDSVMLSAQAMEEVVDARNNSEKAFFVSSEIGMA